MADGWVHPLCAALATFCAALATSCSVVTSLDGIAGVNEPVAQSCHDGVKDGQETDIDCGGSSCAKCEAGRSCGEAADCLSGVCSPDTTTCQVPTCADRVLNGDESDIDCGGACSPCDSGRICLAAGDCLSGVCVGATCRSLDLSVEYYSDDWKTGNSTIGPAFKILNAGPVDVAYADLELSYFYTNDGDVFGEVAVCTALEKLACEDLVFTFSPVSPARPGADRAMRLGFNPASGALAAGTDSGDIRVLWSKSDSSAYDERDDYSCDLSPRRTFTLWPKVALYRKGVLVWGIEPP